MGYFGGFAVAGNCAGSEKKMTGLRLSRLNLAFSAPVIRSRRFPVSPSPAVACILCNTYTDITPKMMSRAVRAQKKQARTVMISCACFIVVWLARLELLNLLANLFTHPVPEIVRLGKCFL